MSHGRAKQARPDYGRNRVYRLHLALALAERGENVVLFDRNPDLRRLTGFSALSTRVQGKIRFMHGDLSLLPHVMEAFDTHHPKSVFHLGALLSAGAEANPTMGFTVDLIGTWHVLDAARIRTGSRCPGERIKFLFPSTIVSFGTHKLIRDGLVPNEAPQLPTTVYGVSKVSSERLGEYYNRKGWIDFRAVRFLSVIGASRGPGGATVYSTLLVDLPAQGKPYTALKLQRDPMLGWAGGFSYVWPTAP